MCSPVSGFGEGSSVESLEKVLADTNMDVQEYLSWLEYESPALWKDIGKELRIKKPPQLSIFEQGYPLFERLAKEIDSWLRFDPSQKELAKLIAGYFKAPYYVEENERSFSFLEVPVAQEYPRPFWMGRTVKGRVDLAIFDRYEERNTGIEIDFLTIKPRSAIKLALPCFDYRMFMLVGDVKKAHVAESLFILAKLAPTEGWENTLVMARNRGLYMGYTETPPIKVVKGQIAMPFEAH
jgi:hypothetical protein